MKYNKKMVLKEFKEYILPYVKEQYENDGKIDRIARREAWSNYTDMLCKEGRITPKQYDNWSNPF